jgi:hypothetical protein
VEISSRASLVIAEIQEKYVANAACGICDRMPRPGKCRTAI